MNKTLAHRLRETTRLMASRCSAPMGLWQEHSNACLEAAKEIERPTKWQSMDTAPQDGRWIIVCCWDGVSILRVSWGRDRNGEMRWCQADSASFGDLFGGWMDCPREGPMREHWTTELERKAKKAKRRYLVAREEIDLDFARDHQNRRRFYSPENLELSSWDTHYCGLCSQFGKGWDEETKTYRHPDKGGGQTCDVNGVLRELEAAGFLIVPKEADYIMSLRGAQASVGWDGSDYASEYFKFDEKGESKVQDALAPQSRYDDDNREFWLVAAIWRGCLQGLIEWRERRQKDGDTTFIRRWEQPCIPTLKSVIDGQRESK